MSEKEIIERAEKAFAEADRKKAEKARVFSVKDVLAQASRIREKEHPQLGLVQYGILNLREMAEISREQDLTKRGILLLCRSLQKADPQLSLEDVEALPHDVAAEITQLIMGDIGFLPAKKP